MAGADGRTTGLRQVEQLLDLQRDALASRDPVSLERANAALAGALDALRRTPPSSHDPVAARRVRPVLRAQAELLARGQAATERALSVLMPEATPAYAERGAARPRAGKRHAIA